MSECADCDEEILLDDGCEHTEPPLCHGCEKDRLSAELSALRARVAELEERAADREKAHHALDAIEFALGPDGVGHDTFATAIEALKAERDAARRDLEAATRFVICNEDGSVIFYINAQADFEWRISQAGVAGVAGYIAQGLTRDAALAEARRLAGEK